MRSNKILDEWRRNTLVPTYKYKMDIQNCANYMRIKIMIHNMKLFEQVIKWRLEKRLKSLRINLILLMEGRP